VLKGNFAKGFVCNKGVYGLDVHNDPNRLNEPLSNQAHMASIPVEVSRH